MKSFRTHVLQSTAALIGVTGLMLSACGKSSSPTTPTPVPPADVTITIVANNGNLSFSPPSAVVTAGKTVAWKNSASDNTTHTAASDVMGAFNTGNIASGATSTKITMSTAGSFPYHCGIHPSMTGTLTVNPAPANLTITIVANNGSLSFDPNPAVMTVGQTVEWKNMAPGGMTHTSTSDIIGVFDTGDILPGATSTKITMSTAGSFGYHCTPHSAMVGTLTVNP